MNCPRVPHKPATPIMHVLEAYLNRLHEIRDTRRGTSELSYRAALENLLNAVGGQLDPPPTSRKSSAASRPC